MFLITPYVYAQTDCSQVAPEDRYKCEQSQMNYELRNSGNYKDLLQQQADISNQRSSSNGGCLIATATFGSELAPQVQKLREIRDSKLLQTESGSTFMKSFNDFYYSFSPTLADWERESPIFKEVVKIGITPMINTMSLMDYADSEAEVLGLGLSVVALNLGIYFVAPAIVIIGIRKKF